MDSKYIAAGPAISWKQLFLFNNTRQPQENASNIGIPNPSYNEGYINAIA